MAVQGSCDGQDGIAHGFSFQPLDRHVLEKAVLRVAPQGSFTRAARHRIRAAEHEHSVQGFHRPPRLDKSVRQKVQQFGMGGLLPGLSEVIQ